MPPKLDMAVYIQGGHDSYKPQAEGVLPPNTYLQLHLARDFYPSHPNLSANVGNHHMVVSVAQRYKAIKGISRSSSLQGRTNPLHTNAVY